LQIAYNLQRNVLNIQDVVQARLHTVDGQLHEQLYVLPCAFMRE